MATRHSLSLCSHTSLYIVLTHSLTFTPHTHTLSHTLTHAPTHQPSHTNSPSHLLTRSRRELGSSFHTHIHTRTGSCYGPTMSSPSWNRHTPTPPSSPTATRHQHPLTLARNQTHARTHTPAPPSSPTEAGHPQALNPEPEPPTSNPQTPYSRSPDPKQEPACPFSRRLVAGRNKGLLYPRAICVCGVACGPVGGCGRV